MAMMMTRSRALIAGVGVTVLIVTLGGGNGFTAVRSCSTAPAAVRRGDVNVTVSATGTPNAVVTVQVGSRCRATSRRSFADFNTKVTKGELIARIDPAPFQTKVNQAQANLDAARAAVANSQAVVQQALANIQAAQSSLARGARPNVVKADAIVEDAKVKVDRRVIMVARAPTRRRIWKPRRPPIASAVADRDALVAQQQAAEDNVKVAQAQLHVANSLVAANQAQVKQFAAALQSAQIDLDHTNIKAPVDGVVVSRSVDVGQTVAASLAAPTLFLIAQDLTKMQVDTNVSEADVGRVRVNQPATFTVDAYPGRTFTGTVTSIREAPINVQNVITYDAVIASRTPDLKLFPGMTANVKILVSQRPMCCGCPNAALRYHPASESRATPAARLERAARRAGEGRVDCRRPRHAAARRDSDRRNRRHVHRGHRRSAEGRRPRDRRGAGDVSAAWPAAVPALGGGRGPGF